jgi:hypothetical protein
VIDTEHVDEPFKEVAVGEKVILGGRSLKLMSDRKDVD